MEDKPIHDEPDRAPTRSAVSDAATASAASSPAVDAGLNDQRARPLDEAHEQARPEADNVGAERERMLSDLRDANEKLVVAFVRAEELAEEANAARASLAETVAALTASEERYRAASRAKDEFLAMLGHELRNPLAPILTALDLMAVRAPNVAEREREIIKRQANHMVRLVDDLLDVSRITGGRIELHRQPIEIAEVVERAVEQASPLLEKKAHVLKINVAPRGLVVDGDPTRLAQVVTNILMNAAKFTPERGTVTITGERRGPSVLLGIRDTGIGISEEMLPRVFDLFAQERQAIDRSKGGLGLGLAIVKSLVEMHGGTCAVRSQGANRGTEFDIVLPALAVAADATHAAPVSEVSTPAGRYKVLVVDDNQDAAELTAEILTGCGHEVRVAFDGPSALAIDRAFVPDVALLDIGLPGMDGYELASRLRAAVAPHQIRFIALTGYGHAVERTRTREAGFAFHLVKPVDFATLQTSIERVMDDSAAT